MCPTFAAGNTLKNPSTIPKPALKIGTTPNFLPLRVWPVVVPIGVSTSQSSNLKSLVTS